MYLAGILALCALLHVPASGGVRSEFLSSASPFTPFLRQDPAQQPASSDPAAGSQSSQPKPDAAPTNQQDQPPPASSEPATPTAQKVAPAPPKPETAASKKKSVKKKTHAPTTPPGEPRKRVVHRGSTVEPTTQLAPGMTGEQAARQRENTNQLLATTDASLQKVSSRQLSKDEQETVSQIRRFTQQAKEANAAGDLQRALHADLRQRLRPHAEADVRDAQLPQRAERARGVDLR